MSITASALTGLFTVFPLRFTAQPAAMIGFLRTLGLAPSLTAGDDAFGDLHAGAGRVMVHGVRSAQSGAASGDTDLCLVVPNGIDAAQRLEAAGFQVDIWDETYGKQGRIGGPAEESISLNEDQTDPYGYREHDSSGADSRIEVVAVLESDDFARDAAYFGRLGFESVSSPDEHWQALRGPGAAGTIGLHAPTAEGRRSRPAEAEFGQSMQVRLGFQTSEDLAALTARLQEAGYDARLVGDQELQAVHVTDPDGLPVEIHMVAPA